MKANTAKRFLALVLSLVMAVGLLPAQALAQALPEPEAQALTSLEKAKLLRELGLAVEGMSETNTDQTDHRYLVNGSPYKVIYNDYIACYVSAEDGSYAVLPAALPLEEDAPTGSALFTIDGADYRFGGDYPDALLLQPQVRGDMVVTDWTIGDYVISQYHAIVEDAGHEDSYAVKVAYAAEYFGQGESEISARLILPAPLGEGEADGVLLTDAGQVLAGASVVTEAPTEMAMLPGEGPRAFFVLDTGADYLAPVDRLTLGERGGLECRDDPMGMDELFVPLSDPAAAYDFAPQTLTVDVETLAQNVYGALVNFGYYDLEPGTLDLEVDEDYERQSDALADALDQAIGLAEAGDRYFTVEGELDIATLRYKPAGGSWTEVEVPERSEEGGGQFPEGLAFIPAGAEIEFTVAEVPEPSRMRPDVRLLVRDEAGSEPTALSPNASGVYTATAPEDGLLMVNFAGQEGYVRLDLNSAYLLDANVAVESCTPSRYFVKVGETVTIRLKADVPFVLDEVYYRKSGQYPIQFQGTGESDPSGQMEFSFVVPQDAYSPDEYTDIGFTLAAATDFHYLSTKVLPGGAVDGGDLTIDVPRTNGIARVKGGTTVTVAVPALAAGYDPEKSTLALLVTKAGGTAPEYMNFDQFASVDPAAPVSFDAIAGQDPQITGLTFTMPVDGDVEVCLTASEAGASAHRVIPQVVHQDAGGSLILPGPDDPQAIVTVLPQVQAAGKTVSVQIAQTPDGSGAKIFDDTLTEVAAVQAGAPGGNVSVTTHATGRDYSFVMPDGDVYLTVTVKQAAAPVTLHTLSTRPLVEGETVRWGVWAREKYTDGRVKPAEPHTGGAVQVPVGTDVEYYIYDADPNDGSWELDRAYLADPTDLTTPLEGYADLEAGYADTANSAGYHTFKMPDQDCVIVLQGVAYPYEIATESLMLTGEVEDGVPVTKPMGSDYAKAYTKAGDGVFTPVTAVTAGELVYVGAVEPVGFTLKELWLLRDGYEDENLILEDPTESYLGAKLYAVTMADRSATLRAVYAPPATIQVHYTPPTDHADLLTYDGGTRALIAATEEKDKYSAMDQLRLTNGDPAIAFFAPLEVQGTVGETDQIVTQTIGGVTVKSTLMGVTNENTVLYNLEYTWPKTAGTEMTLSVPIDSQELNYVEWVTLEDAVVNHTNPEKFNTVTITGDFTNENIKEVSLIRYKGTYGDNPPNKIHDAFYTAEAVYPIKSDKVQIIPGVGDEPDKLVISDLDQAESYTDGKLPDFLIKDVDFRWEDDEPDVVRTFHVDSHPFGVRVTYSNFGPTTSGSLGYTESVINQNLNFRLYKAQVNRAQALDYMSILMDKSDNSYRMRVGETEADVAAPLGYVQVVSFHTKTGFAASDVDENGFVIPFDENTHTSTVSVNNINSWERVKVTFNDCMFLESDLDFDPEVTFTEKDGTLDMLADGLRLNALNTPLYIPTFAGQHTLTMKLEKGTAYSLNTTATEAGGAQPLTFEPGGPLYLGVSITPPGADKSLTIEGFSAGVDAIEVTRTTVDVSGHLWMTWPLAKDVAYGGAELERLALEINDGQRFAAQFKGVAAEGGITLPSLGPIGGESYCMIDTFEHQYAISASASVGPGSLGGELSLVRSEALGILIPDTFMVDVEVDGLGIPLVPPVTLAELNGLYGGFDGLSKLIDGVADLGSYETKFLNFRLIMGGHFTLLEILGIDASFSSGFYDLIAEVSANVGLNDDLSLNILDSAQFGFGLVGLPARTTGGVGRFYARVFTSADLNIGISDKVEDFVKGGVNFEVGIIFDNPLKGIDTFFDQIREGSVSLRELVNSLGLTYVAESSGYATVSFPKIMGFIGPYELASVGLMSNMGTTLNWDDHGQLGGVGYASYVASGSLGGVYKVWAKIDLTKGTLDFGRGDPPPEYSFKSGLKEMTPFALSQASVLSLSMPEDVGQPRLLSDTEAAGGMALMAAEDEPGAALKLFASKEPTGFAYRFTLDDQTAAGRYLLVRQVGGYDPAQLRLYGPDGQEVPLNVWMPRQGETDTMLQGEADFVYNAFFQPEDNVWLITAPQAAGDWTLTASREMAVQLWEEPYGTVLGEVSVGGDPLTGGGSSMDHDTITVPLTGLEPGAEYRYALSLVRRTAPTGDALATLPISLDASGELMGAVSGDTITVDLSQTPIPTGLDSGDYYPLVTLYRVGEVLSVPGHPELNGSEGTAPVAQITGYTPIKVTNATLDAATAGSLSAEAGPNQSLDLSFNGASKDGDYSAVTAAGMEISAYQIAIYDQNGDPVLTKNADVLGQAGNRAQGGPAEALIPYTVREALTYGESGLDPADQDNVHSLNLSGLEPGTYTVGVTPLFRTKGVDGLERAGAETRSGPVEVKAAVYPGLRLSVTGGKYEPGTGTGGTLYVSEEFTLTVAAEGVDRAHIAVSTYGAYADQGGKAVRNDQVLKELDNVSSLELTAKEYFGEETDRGDYDNLLITATDPATKGTSTQLVRVVPVTSAPFLALDHGQLAAVGNGFTVSGRTEAGLTVHLLNAGYADSVQADALGRFSFSGTLPAGTAPADLQLAVSVNGPAGHNATETVQFTKYAAEDFSALVLSPGGAVNMTEGDAMALTVKGVLKESDAEVVLSPSALIFTTTGAAKVANGTLTAGAGTGTVTAKLGTLTSNVLTVSGEKKVEPKPTPSGGGGGGANTYRVTAAPGVNGSFEVSPKTAAKGKTVTITPKPDAGYAVDAVLVTDSKGEQVPVTAQADGTYTFTMPGRAVTVTVTFQPDAWEDPFTDVAESDWFYPYVAYVHQKGLFAGTSDTAFSPNVTMSRAMLWTVLARLDGQDTTGGTTWYEQGRAWAMAEGVSDGTDPEGPVTREQVAAMLYRYAEAKGADVSGRADLSKFGDAPSISAWASDALAWANAGGIVTGKPGDLLDPQGQATRAEVAAMLQRYLEGGTK